MRFRSGIYPRVRRYVVLCQLECGNLIAGQGEGGPSKLFERTRGARGPHLAIKLEPRAHKWELKERNVEKNPGPMRPSARVTSKSESMPSTGVLRERVGRCPCREAGFGPIISVTWHYPTQLERVHGV